MNTLTLTEVCRRVSLPEHAVIEIVEVGIVTPVAGSARAWRFDDQTLVVLSRAARLHEDLALDWLNKAVDVQPHYSYRYASRGWMKQACGDLRGAIEDYKRTVELDPEDAVTWNNLGLLEEQLGYQEQAKERYRVSDELLGILKERGIDPETDAPAFRERPQQPTLPDDPSPAETSSKSFWGEIRRAVGTTDGRSELWDFIRNGFTLKG